MIYRLKADTRQDIEDQIPFELYREDEEGSNQLIPATRDYSYHFIGKHIVEPGEYDDDGNMISEPALSDYVLADINIYNGQELSFKSPVESIKPETPMHGWQ